MALAMASPFRLAFACAALVVAGVSAQRDSQPPKSQVPTLGRPTKPTDETPLFNFDEYFNGKWTVEWDVPDGVMGSAGTITGTTVYQPIGGKFYQATTEAKGPDGDFKVTEVIAYQRDNRALSRHVTDSRGFDYLETATIGGDLGGYFTISWESAPFSYRGKTLRIKHLMRLLSPVNYRVATTVSTAGGPFANYGNPWWKKQ
jgi:hypothetical protein